jgi:hypothetical protein
MKNFLKSFLLLLIVILSVQNLNALNVSGKVLYQNDSIRPINNVKVILKNVLTNSTQTYTTGGNGFYQFSNVPNGNYSLSGTTLNASGGVTFYDAIMVFLNIFGLYQFTPLQFLASDVNGSGTITWTDYNLIISHILLGTPFPVGPWKFETSVFTISNMKEGIPHGLGGTCSGDVGGTFVPTVNTLPAIPVAQDGVINVSSSEPFTTRILTRNDISISGAGIIINYPENLLRVESVEFKGNDFEYNIAEGQIRLVWGNPNTAAIHFTEGETFITIHGVSKADFKQGMTASINLDGNTSLINTSNKEVTDLHFASPVIKYGNPALKLSNFPNPFHVSTTLSIYTPVDGDATIEVYNTSGQLVKSIPTGHMNAGTHEVSLDASQLSQGYYLCKMRLQGSSDELSTTVRILKAD